MIWQKMIRALARAGNGAGKTESKLDCTPGHDSRRTAPPFTLSLYDFPVARHDSQGHTLNSLLAQSLVVHSLTAYL